MGITWARVLRAALAALSVTAGAGVTLWAHLMLGFGADLLGQPQALAPSFINSPASYALLVGLHVALLFPVLWIGAVLSGPWPIRALNLLLLAGGWYWVADQIAFQFAADFGATWLAGEPFTELFYDPVLTPAFVILALAAQIVALRLLNRRPAPKIARRT